MTVRKKIGITILLGLGLLLTCMLIPAVQSQYAVYRRRACESRLRLLYGALVAYRQAHGVYPKKLSELYPTCVSDLNMFVCPGSPRKIRNASEIDALTGYVLLPPDLGEWGRKWGMKPLLSDHRYNHPFKGNDAWYDAVLYDDEGMPAVFWMFDRRSIDRFGLISSNRYDFIE